MWCLKVVCYYRMESNVSAGEMDCLICSGDLKGEIKPLCILGAG